MMSQSNVKSDFVMPILVLALICLVMSAVLAVTNNVTEPIIAATEQERAEAARMQVLPEADNFELVNVDNLPDSVTEVYKATNGVGYVFMLSCDGYGGKGTLKLICGIDSEGYITTTQTLSHSETAGLGSKVTDPNFKDQFDGLDSSLEGLVTISGATISSNHYIDGIRDAFAAYELVKEGV